MREMRIVFICILLTFRAAMAGAEERDRRVQLAGVVAQEQIAPLIAALAARLPGAELSYSRMSSTQIAEAVLRQDEVPFDIALLSAPDIAVSIANEGYAARDDAAGSIAMLHWRNEVFGFWADPAVMVLRKSAFQDRLPRTRIELARALEQNVRKFSKRVGVVNVGIDDVSYLLASQDAMRTSLYWRLMQSIGEAQARIFDTTDDLLEALRAGDLDIVYNIPLSALHAEKQLPKDIEIVVPQDYLLAVPWTVLTPKRAPNPRGARIVLEALLSGPPRPALAASGFELPSDSETFESQQRIELGPELLVFRDMFKRSKFLDIWFQTVVK